MFLAAQDALGIPRGTIRATVLIETILAAFEMDEILWELRDHSAGLNCGRWDYIFSFIKKFRNRPGCVLPDRAQVTMTSHFLGSYVDLLIATCHRRGAHAMGGMAAQIPIKNDPVANEAALAKRARGQTARGVGRARRHLGGASRPGSAGQGDFRHLHAARRTRSATPESDRDVTQRICSAVPPAPSPRTGLGSEPRCRPAIPGSLAGRRTAACRSTT